MNIGFGGVTILQVIIIFAMFWIYVHPLVSKQVRGWQRFNWFILSILFSFAGYLLYYAIAIKWNRRKSKKEPFTWPSTNAEQWMRR